VEPRDPAAGRPAVDDELLTKAFALAARLHRADLRKGTAIPYLAHPMAVAALVLEHGGTDEQAAAALLHDVVEDHGGRPRLEEIRASLGRGVADIVEDCSDAFVAEGETKPPWRDRKERYLAHLAAVAETSLLVSCADKLHHARAIVTDARSLGPSLWERFNASPADLAWYYRSLSDTFTARLTTDPAATLAQALAGTVAELEAEAAKVT
jgi:(p)ppGpp synthase/HD superfamily hydrolase